MQATLEDGTCLGGGTVPFPFFLHCYSQTLRVFLSDLAVVNPINHRYRAVGYSKCALIEQERLSSLAFRVERTAIDSEQVGEVRSSISAT